MTITKAPAPCIKAAEAATSIDKIIESCTIRQKNICHFLRHGKFSAADISRRLGYADPRGHIRNIRKKGITICDEWIKCEDGTRFKRYFIK